MTELREKVARLQAAADLPTVRSSDGTEKTVVDVADLKAILNLIGGDGWKPRGTEPAACTVIATRFDDCEWAYAVVDTPIIQPFTHWRPLPPPPPVTP